MNEQNLNNLDQIRNIIFGDESQKIERRFAQIEKSIKDVKKDLDDSVANLDNKIETLTNQTQTQHNKSLQEIEKTKSTLENIIASRVEELETQIAELGQDKTDRKALANMLIELAMNLKGEDLMTAITQEVGVGGEQE